MLSKIKSLDNPMLQAYALSYLISNKKVSKILKSSYIKYFNNLLPHLRDCYYTFEYVVDIKSFFNPDNSTNNIVPTFLNTNNFIEYNLTLNYMIKNKHIVEDIIEDSGIINDRNNFKIIKKLLAGKIDLFEFETEYGEMITIRSEDLQVTNQGKKYYKENVTFTLPNVNPTNNISTYPLSFTHIVIKNASLHCYIFSEEDIRTTPHHVLSKVKSKKLLL